MRGSEVTEQVLNLTPEEINKIWNALIVNAQPENAVYRYNFFFDNCATRPVAIVEELVNGKVKYNDPPEPQTFRDLINYCTRNNSWLTFGCDLALGSPTDRIATPHEMMFLPVYLKDEFEKATIVNPDGSERKLIKQTNRLSEELINDTNTTKEWFTPMLCSMIIFLLVLSITFVEWKRKPISAWWTASSFSLQEWPVRYYFSSVSYRLIPASGRTGRSCGYNLSTW